VKLDLIPFRVPIDQIFNAIKDQSCVWPGPSHLTQEGLDLVTIVLSMKGGHLKVDYRTLRRHLQDLINEGYLREFVLNPILPLEVRVQRQPEALAEHPGSTLVQYREVNTIFENSSIEDTTIKERTLYANEAWMDNLVTVTRPPTSPDRPVFFSKKTRMSCTSHTMTPWS